MLLIIFLLFLPVNADLNVFTSINKNGTNTFFVKHKNIITDDNRNFFKINCHDIFNEIKGKWPTDCWYKEPTKNFNLYKTYKWDEVETHLILERIEEKERKVENFVVAIQNCTNKSNFTINCRSSNSVILTNKISNKKVSTENTGLKIGVKNNFIIENDVEISHNHLMGEEKTESLGHKFSFNSEVSVQVEPGQNAVIKYMSKKIKNIFSLKYRSYLTGHITANYYPAWQGHHFYAYIIPVHNFEKSFEEELSFDGFLHTESSIVVEGGIATRISNIINVDGIN